MDIRPRLVYFDNNAIANLFQVRQGRSAELLLSWRVRLVHRVTVGATILVVSLYALEEYFPVRLSDRDRYLATLDFLQWHVRAPLIAPTEELALREIKHRRMLLPAELGLDEEATDRVWTLARSGQALEAIALETKAKKSKYDVSTRESLGKIRRAFEEVLLLPENSMRQNLTLAHVARSASAKDLKRMISDLVSKALPQVLERNGLSTADMLDVSPEMLPTLQNHAAYTVGRMVRNAAGARVKPSDAHDHDHYAAARYTDLLVTDDREFRDTVALLDPTFPTSTFDDFFQNPCGPIVSFPED